MRRVSGETRNLRRRRSFGAATGLMPSTRFVPSTRFAPSIGRASSAAAVAIAPLVGVKDGYPSR
jgi:hypothetical protein